MFPKEDDFDWARAIAETNESITSRNKQEDNETDTEKNPTS